MIGVKVCDAHGRSPNVKAASARARLRDMVTAIGANDWEADPLNAFDMEHRRTIAAIRYFDEKLAELANEDDLIWGKTAEEAKNATEFIGTDTKYEAKMNIYYEARFRERMHLTDLHKLYIAAKLDSKRLKIERDVMDRLESVISSVILGLGHNQGDPEVRAVVRQALLPVAS